jgi:hypothetical protein
MKSEASRWAKRIGRPLSSWMGDCYTIARLVIDHGLVRGVARYGAYMGEIAPGSMFADRADVPGGVNHGWVELKDGRVVDPTRWVFEDVEPYIYRGENRGEYDAGAQNRRALFRLPCPEYKGVRRVPRPRCLDVSTLSNGAINGRMDRSQAQWLLSGPLSQFEGVESEVLAWAERNRLMVYFPIDNLQIIKERAGRETKQ